MADPRIQTIGEIPVQSGVGQMLFEQMEKTREREADLKQVGAIAGIQSKHRMAEQENANKLAVGMENLRNQLTIQRTQQAFQQEQAVKQQGAAYLQGLIGQAGQQGIAMPGLATPTIGTPEAGIPGVPSVAPIQPGAVDIARDVYSRNILSHLEGIERRDNLSMEKEKMEWERQLDLITDSDAREIEMLASHFDASGDRGAAALVRSYAKPGQGSKSAWEKAKLTAFPRLMEAQAANQTRMAVAVEVSSRAKEVANITSQASRLLAIPTLEMHQFKQLQGYHASLATQLNGYESIHKQMLERLWEETDPAKQTEVRSKLREMEVAMQGLQVTMTEVGGKLAAFTPTVTPAGGTPVPRPTMDPSSPAPPAAGGGWGKVQKVK